MSDESPLSLIGPLAGVGFSTLACIFCFCAVRQCRKRKEAELEIQRAQQIQQVSQVPQIQQTPYFHTIMQQRTQIQQPYPYPYPYPYPVVYTTARPVQPAPSAPQAPLANPENPYLVSPTSAPYVYTV
jgi:hypothetical protein